MPSSKLKNHFEQIIRYKSDRMKKGKDYESYRRQLIKELGIKELEQAFLVGAVDAMIFDVATALALGPAYMRQDRRKKLIRAIFTATE